MKLTVDADDQITRDLMRKVSDDVIGALRRVMSIAPAPHLPIAVSAGGAAIGFVSAALQYMTNDRQPGDPPDPECILLAGLLCARMGIGGDDPIGAAYADMKALTDAGRLALKDSPNA